VQLTQEEPACGSKRKHSEIVRLEKPNKIDISPCEGQNTCKGGIFRKSSSPFDMPMPREQVEANGKKRVNKLMSKHQKRNRFMTESVAAVKTRLGFLPTKTSDQTLISIQTLRDSQIPKPEIGKCLKIPLHKLSTDEGAISVTGVSNSGKKASVKLLKLDKDMKASTPSFNRFRFQTF
jgi:hypothetical protein